MSEKQPDLSTPCHQSIGPFPEDLYVDSRNDSSSVDFSSAVLVNNTAFARPGTPKPGHGHDAPLVTEQVGFQQMLEEAVGRILVANKEDFAELRAVLLGNKSRHGVPKTSEIDGEYEKQLSEVLSLIRKLEEITETQAAELASKGEVLELRQNLETSESRCRALFKQIQDMKGNIRVMCRIRPPHEGTTQEELADFGPRHPGDFSPHWGKMCLPKPRKNARGEIVTDVWSSFDFERVFAPEDTNKDVFDEVKDVIQCALRGEKVCIFMYGGSGSGKTFTMSHRNVKTHDSSANGIIPQTLDLIFKTAQDDARMFRYTPILRIIEIYKNDIFDLLKTDETAIEKTKLASTADSAQKILHSPEEARNCIVAAEQMRAVGATNVNQQSSRSHLIIHLGIRREALTGDPTAPTTTVGLLYLVDLAGSERVAESGSRGERLEEGIEINRSLTSLNSAIHSLGAGYPVAYDNPLTKTLRPCLERPCKTLMFVTVSPLKRDLSVTMQTLEQAKRAASARLASRVRVKTTSFSSPAKAAGTVPSVGAGATSAAVPSLRRVASVKYPAPPLREQASGRTRIPAAGSSRKSTNGCG